MDVLYRTTGRRHEPMPPPEVSCLGLMVTGDGEVVVPCISGEERPGQVLLHTHGRGGWDRREVTRIWSRPGRTCGPSPAGAACGQTAASTP